METKKHILICIDWYLPGYKAGGPIRSCANIIAALKDDFHISVITSDTDFSDQTPYTNVKSNSWNFTDDGTRVYYFSTDRLHYENIKKIIEEENPDILYMNSFFSEPFTLYPLLVAKGSKNKYKTVVAPRGMLGEGALQLKSLKKKFFIRAMKWLGAYKNVRWHASTEQEKKEVQKVLGKKADVRVALNLSSVKISSIIDKHKEIRVLKLVFFSRVSVKKNLHLVIGFLKKISEHNEITFDIYGTLEDEQYWKDCEKLISELPPNVTASYKGVVSSERIPEIFAHYHFSILPTMHENYGHSIVESFAQGVPVILSDQTPWRNLTEQKAGWDIPLSKPEKFMDALRTVCTMDNQVYKEWQAATLNLAHKVLDNNEVVNQNKLLFKF